METQKPTIFIVIKLCCSYWVFYILGVRFYHILSNNI